MVVFSGENGAGKTNLLEADLAADARARPAARALRRPRARRAAQAASRPRRAGRSGRAIRDRHRHGRARPRQRDRHGACASTARRPAADDMLEWLRVLWLTPAMDALFTGPGRRSPPLPRPARAGGRSRPWPPRARLREGDARAQPAARRGFARSRMVRRDRDADGGDPASAIAAARAETGAAAGGDDRQAAGCGPSRKPISPLTARSRRWSATWRRSTSRRRSGRRWPRAASATARPDARSTARIAPTSWCATARRRCRPNSARPASRRRCWSASCFRMRACPARCPAACRSCFSTRSPHISTPAAAPRSSRSSTNSAARPS